LHRASRIAYSLTLPLVQTRYLIIASLVTAIVILGASLIWFLIGIW